MLTLLLEDIVEDVRIYPCGDKAYTDGQHILPESLQLGTEVNMLATVLTARCAGYLGWHTDLCRRLQQGTQWKAKKNEVDRRFFRSFQNHVLARDLSFLVHVSNNRERRISRVKADMEELGDIWRPKDQIFQLSEVKGC